MPVLFIGREKEMQRYAHKRQSRRKRRSGQRYFGNRIREELQVKKGNHSRKFLAALLTAVMVFTAVSVMGSVSYAEEASGGQTGTVTEETQAEKKAEPTRDDDVKADSKESVTTEKKSDTEKSSSVKDAAAKDETVMTKVTFNISGEGTVTVTEVSDKMDKAAAEALLEKTVTNGYSFEYPAGEAFRLKAKSSAGHIKIETGDKNGVDEELTEDSDSGKLEKFISVTEKEMIINMTFSDADKKTQSAEAEKRVGKAVTSLSSLFSAKATSYTKGTMPKKGDTYTGRFTVTDISGGYGHTLNWAKMQATSGFLKTAGVGVLKSYCMDHGDAAPVPGQNGDYKATITKVNASTGLVEGKVIYTGLGAGYQRLKTDTFTVKIPPQEGYARVLKKSANTSITNNNPKYSLEGAVYTVYADSSRTKKAGTLTTAASGYSNKLKLKPGTYYLYETKAAKGYTLFNEKGKRQTYSLKVTAGQTTTLTVKDTPMSDPTFVMIQKYDSERGEKVAVTDGSLAGAQFTVKFYATTKKDVTGLKPARTWVFKTNKKGQLFMSNVQDHFVSGSSFFKDLNGHVVYPLGTYTIQETKAPAGYTADKTVYTRQVTENGTTGVVVNNEIKVPEKPVRGDFKFVKTGADSKTRLANVKFRITSKKSGESRIIWTDDDGCYSSSSKHIKHSADTNSDKTGAGIWFGDIGKLSDDQGALPYGEYTLEELECEANKAYKLIEPVTFTVKKDAAVVDLGTIVNSQGKVKTTALDADTNDHISAAKKEITIIDKVSYEDLIIGKTYSIKGTLMDKETGEPVMVDGRKVTSEKEITAETASGTIDVEFKFDGTGLAGKRLVVFETVYYEDQPYAVHADLNDEDQSIDIPKIGTKASGKDTDTNLINSSGKQTIVDTISYSRLPEGKTYKAKGWLVDKEGNKIDGTETEKEFTPDDENGSVDVEITFDTSEYEGQDVIVFEEVYCNGKLVAQHKDLKDSGQTIHVPRIGTKASGKDSGINMIKFEGKQTIVDTISYENLIKGEAYKAKGWLVDDEGNRIDGTVAEKDFTAENADGSVDVEITFDTSGIKNKVTVFEEIYLNGNLVGEHKDKGDSDQTVYAPKIGTKAIGKDTGSNVINGTGKQTITDTISYTGLAPGKSYKAKGWLVDEEGNRIEGTETEKEFTAEKSSGTVEVEITFEPSKCAGKNVVVFEEVYAEGTLVAEHKDADDNDQTVKIPHIGTKAAGKDTNTNMIAGKGEQVIIDTVAYENLNPGEKYTAESWLVDKDGKKIEGTEATTEFTPKDRDGEVQIPLKVNGDAVKGMTLVVFEELYNADGKLVGEHKDTEDADQTVTVPKIGTKADGAMLNRIKDTGSQTIVDTISYRGLETTKTYKVTSWLVDKSTGKEIEGTRAETSFKPAKAEGVYKVKMNISTDSLAGKSLVAYEEITLDGNFIAEHKDINDKEQTVTVPPDKHVPKTGDSLPLAVVISAIVFAASAILMVIMLRRKKYVE